MHIWREKIYGKLVYHVYFLQLFFLIKQRISVIRLKKNYVYDYLGGSIEQTLFLKPGDEEDIIITVKACTKVNYSDYEDISMDIFSKVI